MKKAHRRVTNRDVSGVGWSRYWSPPRGLRWLPESEVRYGRKYVAYKSNSKHITTWYVTWCYTCGGRFLASRSDAEFCSFRCTKENERRVKACP